MVAAVFLLFSSQCLAGGDLFDNVSINYQLRRARKDSSKSKAQVLAAWKFGCRQLGAALTARKSPWVYGPFNSYSCKFNNKTFSGKKKSKFAIEIADGKSSLTISVVQFGSSKKQRTVLASFSLEPTQNFTSFFRDPEFVDLLALSMSESLPAAGVLSLTSAKLKNDRLVLTPVRKGKSRAPKYEYPATADKLVFYRLDWDAKNGLWKSDVVGTAKLDKTSSQEAYVLEKEVQQALKSGPLYLHRSEGPVDAEERWKSPVKKSTKTIDLAIASGKFTDFLKGMKTGIFDTFLSTAASGYFGFKYGLQVLPPQGELGRLIGKTSMLSLLVEIRSGPVKGLRYYYDKLPETSDTVTMFDGSKEKQQLGFSRHILGYSFGFDFDGFINRISIDPKFGIWTFNARLPAELDESGKVTKVEDFNLGRTFSLAMEGGVENISDWYVLRGWGGMDTGFSLLKSGGKVSSYRYGVDAFLTAGPEIPFFKLSLKTTWVVFYVYDKLVIEAKKEVNPEAGEAVITGIEYEAAYAGAGVALSW